MGEGASAAIEAPPGATFDDVRADDGTRLRIAYWRPAGANRTAILLNGRAEFIEKHFETVGDLLARGYRVWTMDWRGQGLSDRPLGDRMKGHVAAFDDYLMDLAALLDAIERWGDGTPDLVLGHSMASAIVLRFLRRQPNAFGAAVLTGPMIGIHIGKWPASLSRWLTAVAAAGPFERAYVIGENASDWERKTFDARNRLTSDPDRFAHTNFWIRRNADLILGGPTWRWLRESFAALEEVQDPAFGRQITTPVLFCMAGRERVVVNAATRALAGRMPRAEIVEFTDAKHEILKENDEIRGTFWAALDRFTAAVLGPQQDERGGRDERAERG